MKAMQTEINTCITNETVSEKLYDLCMIERLCHGDEHDIKNMVKVFMEETLQAVDDIKSAYERRDFIMLKRVAHKIRPVLGYYAIIKLEKEILQIEALAEEQLAGYEFELSINKLETILNIVIDQLNQTYPTNN
jgi:HPt (histidine-containing phosphotransfer) domain-containing protein